MDSPQSMVEVLWDEIPKGIPVAEAPEELDEGEAPEAVAVEEAPQEEQDEPAGEPEDDGDSPSHDGEPAMYEEEVEEVSGDVEVEQTESTEISRDMEVHREGVEEGVPVEAPRKTAPVQPAPPEAAKKPVRAVHHQDEPVPARQAPPRVTVVQHLDSHKTEQVQMSRPPSPASRQAPAAQIISHTNRTYISGVYNTRPVPNEPDVPAKSGQVLHVQIPSNRQATAAPEPARADAPRSSQHAQVHVQSAGAGVVRTQTVVASQTVSSGRPAAPAPAGHIPQPSRTRPAPAPSVDVNVQSTTSETVVRTQTVVVHEAPSEPYVSGVYASWYTPKKDN